MCSRLGLFLFPIDLCFLCNLTHTLWHGRIGQIRPFVSWGLEGGFSKPLCHGAIWPGSGCLSRILSQDTLHGGRRDAVSFCDLAQALALAAVPLDGSMVEFQRVAADVLAFKAGAPHAGPHPLDDQVALEFGDGANDDYDGSAQRAAGIDILPEADVLDLQPV